MNDRQIKKIIDLYNIHDKESFLSFLSNNNEELSIINLSRIAELMNNNRVDTAAYYTDLETLNYLESALPIINKETIRVLEPSVGVGNFLNIIIKKYSYAPRLIIDVNDIDINSLDITKILNLYREIPENVEINYLSSDFLFLEIKEKYDLVIGNPPFIRLTKEKKLDEYSSVFKDETTKNIAGFFIQKSLSIGDYVVMILPKYFLSNPDFSLTRDRVSNYAIDRIIDFGEKGFKGVLIETIAICIDKNKCIDQTECISVTNNIKNIQPQSKLVSDEYPYWLMYRDSFFDEISSKMKFNIFSVFRDRQLTNSKLSIDGEIRVLKSRNIKRDGTGIIDIENYDSYIKEQVASKLSVWNYYEKEDVYLSPNMTYYPRVIKKPKDVLMNGSVAVLENISNYEVKDEHLLFLSSPTFEKYYRIARNYSTRSLNIDSNSVYFFGLYDEI